MSGNREAASLPDGELLDEGVGVLGVEENGTVPGDVAERDPLGSGEPSAVPIGLEAPSPRTGGGRGSAGLGIEEVGLLGSEDGGKE
jgi:hypothetical protein